MIVGGAEGTVRQDWEPEGLIEVWTLLEDDMKKVRNKSGPTRLGFALLLKFFEVEAGSRSRPRRFRPVGRKPKPVTFAFERQGRFRR